MIVCAQLAPYIKKGHEPPTPAEIMPKWGEDAQKPQLPTPADPERIKHKLLAFTAAAGGQIT